MEAAECPVCLQAFDWESTIPRVLPCGHSVCDSCLIALPKPPFPRTIRCPACTQLLPYQSPSNLPKNIDLLRISNPNPNPKPKPTKTPTLEHFIPHPWSHHFFSNWKDWIAPQHSLSLDGTVLVDLMASSSRCLFKRDQKVSLFKLGSFMHHGDGEENNKFKYSYIAKATWVLFKMGDGALAELELILRSGYRICAACGLWYNEEDDGLYLVCEKKQTNLADVIVADVVVDVSGFAMIGMEICEAMSRLHDVELVAGCTSLSCFGVDDFGRVYIDLNEVFMVGGTVQKLAVSFAQSERHDALPSPEVLVEFVQKESKSCVVGYGSDSWSLACVLLWFVLGKGFVEETHDYLCSYVVKLVNGNGNDCEGLHVAWLDKVSGLLDSKLGSDYVLMKELLCKCLCHDPGARPLVVDVWKCMRGLIISPKVDVTVSTERKTTLSGSTCHCLLLGDLLWSSFKTNVVDDNKDILVDGSDVIEGVARNSLTCTDLKGHLDCVSGLAIGGGFLFSSSFDKTINVWSLQGLNHVHTFKGHEHKVMAIVFVDGGEVPLCISGDNGGDIFIWAIKLPLEEKPIKRLNGDKDWRYSGIHALAALSGLPFFYTGNGDKSVKAWSMHV